jgi:hypothetical protein
VGWLPDSGLVVNPSASQMAGSRLDLVMAGTAEAVLMIEGFCDFLTEEEMLQVGGGGGGGQGTTMGWPVQRDRCRAGLAGGWEACTPC